MKSEGAQSDSEHEAEHEHEACTEPERAEHEPLEALDAGRPRKVICYTCLDVHNQTTVITAKICICVNVCSSLTLKRLDGLG